MSHLLSFHVRIAFQTVICAVCACALSLAADEESSLKNPNVHRNVHWQLISGSIVSVEIPPPRTQYMGREIAQTMHYTGAPWLVRESRQREEDCRLLLEALQIKPGQTICDLGCGNGFYTLELARRVGPEGTVYAVDIQPQMLRLLVTRARQEKIFNIKPVLGTFIDPRLPKGEVDLVFCVDVYHEFSHPEKMLKRIRESLSDGGQIVLAEFRGEDATVPIKPLHKMTKAQVKKELEPNGFVLQREFDQLPWQHLMFFGVQNKE